MAGTTVLTGSLDTATRGGTRPRRFTHAGIPVHWIVNLRARTVEVYTEPDGERYRERSTRSEDESRALPGERAEPVAVRDLLPAPQADD